MAAIHPPVQGIDGRAATQERSFEPIALPATLTAAHAQQAGGVEPKKNDFATQWNYKPGPGIMDTRGETLRAHRPTVIVVWMRKGGVGKTSTTLQVAHALAKAGKRTMMVDCDSQQDLTELTFRAAADAADKEVGDYLNDKFSDTEHHPHLSNMTHGRTVGSLAESVSYVLGTRPGQPPNFPGMEHATGCNLMKPHPFPAEHVVFPNSEGGGAVTHKTENLFLVQGGNATQFEAMESALNQHINDLKPDRNANSPGAMFHAIWNASYDCKAEYVVLDLSPALGVTNELLLMHADQWIVPCEVNKLSEKNLDEMATQFGTMWKKYECCAEYGRARTGIRDTTRGLVPDRLAQDLGCVLPLPDVYPKFLGIVMGKYAVGKACKVRNLKGELVSPPTHEGFKNRTLRERASTLLQTAKHVAHHTLTRPSGACFRLSDDRYPNQLAVSTPTNPLPQKLPQPQLLGRVKRGPPLFEVATSVLGKPITMVTDQDLEALQYKQRTDPAFQASITQETPESVAHFQRIFADLAGFLVHLRENPDPNDRTSAPIPYNFVFDPNCGSVYKKIAAHNNGFVDGYPEDDDDQFVDPNRTAILRWD